jgi:hypothetical protein
LYLSIGVIGIPDDHTVDCVCVCVCVCMHIYCVYMFLIAVCLLFAKWFFLFLWGGGIVLFGGREFFFL